MDTRHAVCPHHTHTGRHTYRREERSGTARALLHTGASPLKLFLGRRFYATRSCRVVSMSTLHYEFVCVCVTCVVIASSTDDDTQHSHTSQTETVQTERRLSGTRVPTPNDFTNVEHPFFSHPSHSSFQSMQHT